MHRGLHFEVTQQGFLSIDVSNFIFFLLWITWVGSKILYSPLGPALLCQPVNNVSVAHPGHSEVQAPPFEYENSLVFDHLVAYGRFWVEGVRNFFSRRE